MRYLFRPLRLRDTRVVAGWRYTGAYAFYDLDGAVMVEALLLHWLLRLVGAQVGYYAVFDADALEMGQQGKAQERGAEAEALVGVFSFERDRDGIVEIGLGMRPTLTGRGEGLGFVQAGLAYGRANYAPRGFRLHVAAFNERAMIVYQRAGFQKVRTFMRVSGGRRYEEIEMRREV